MLCARGLTYICHVCLSIFSFSVFIDLVRGEVVCIYVRNTFKSDEISAATFKKADFQSNMLLLVIVDESIGIFIVPLNLSIILTFFS